jgi:hypothetical protein
MKTLFVLAAFAAAIASPALAQTAPRSGHAVISAGQYLGADPDANVRFDLLREQNFRNGGY